MEENQQVDYLLGSLNIISKKKNCRHEEQIHDRVGALSKKTYYLLTAIHYLLIAIIVEKNCGNASPIFIIWTTSKTRFVEK